jgi:hypothetical protein
MDREQSPALVPASGQTAHPGACEEPRAGGQAVVGAGGAHDGVDCLDHDLRLAVEPLDEVAAAQRHDADVAADAGRVISVP